MAQLFLVMPVIAKESCYTGKVIGLTHHTALQRLACILGHLKAGAWNVVQNPMKGTFFQTCAQCMYL